MSSVMRRGFLGGVSLSGGTHAPPRKKRVPRENWTGMERFPLTGSPNLGPSIPKMRMLVISLTDGRMNDDRERVVAVVEHLKRTTGTPARIAVDNGPEVISKALDAWAYQ